MNARRMWKSQGGFTLMELLIVIVILGFLIGMIAPRLASIIGDDVIDNICDTNNKGMRQYVNMFLQKTGRLPNDMLNLVDEDAGGGTYTDLTASNDDPTDGAEFLASDFDARNDPRYHALTAAEADEIKEKFGIAKVRNVNPSGNQPAFERVDIAAALNVSMVGDITAVPVPADWMANLAAPDYPQGNPFWYGRIVLGIGNQSELVTEGYIQAAALCPGGIQNADNVVYNNYCLILPRLDATAADINGLAGAPADGVTLHLQAADDTGATDANGEVIDVEIEGQEAWQFEFTCPEGHKWPDNDNDNWNLTLVD